MPNITEMPKITEYGQNVENGQIAENGQFSRAFQLRTWVLQPERPKGAKDKVGARRAPQLEVGARRAPRLLVISIFQY